MSQSNEVRYTARSITPPADRDSSPPPKRRAASRSPSLPLPPPPPFPPKGVRTISSRSPPPKRRSTSRSPPPKRRGRSRSPSPKRRGRSRSPSPKKRGRSRSPSPKRRGRSRSKSRNKSRSRSRDDIRNPGNNLYVTGLSTRTSSEDLEKFFSKEGKVKDCHIVVDPRSKEPRGFAFVTMENVEDARRCIKYLHRTVLEGRLISVAKWRAGVAFSMSGLSELCSYTLESNVGNGETPLVSVLLRFSPADFPDYSFHTVGLPQHRS